MESDLQRGRHVPKVRQLVRAIMEETSWALLEFIAFLPLVPKDIGVYHSQNTRNANFY